jgi:uncharacterized protein (DUF1800 family)
MTYNADAMLESQEGRRGDDLMEHLLRRAGFGASQTELEFYDRFSVRHALIVLLNYQHFPDDVDSFIGTPGYSGIAASGGFNPRINIAHARQRWLFRMVHSQRPLQEKMALFWHNHFATAYSKIAGTFGADEGARYMNAKPSEDPNGVKGQLELLREFAVGNFRDLLIAIAKDVAMLVWLDGRTNVRNRPQENYARELMELFTMGVGTFTEEDVYAGARVFTGWNLARPNNAYYTFNYNAAQHDPTAKTFSFAIYQDGNKTIPARSAADGMQDGIDLINAVARHPATGPRLARKLYEYFVSEVNQPDERLINELAQLYYSNNFEMKPVLAHLFLSQAFEDQSNRYARYAWPAEFVARSLKEVGWAGFSLNDALTPMANMGQQLFEPPDVNGWDLGRGWFSTGGMLARMNYAAALTTNQKFNLRDAVRGKVQSPETLVSFLLDRLSVPAFSGDAHNALLDYARAGGAWTGSDTQLATKAAGVVHLIVGSGDYQLV